MGKLKRLTKSASFFVPGLVRARCARTSGGDPKGGV